MRFYAHAQNLWGGMRGRWHYLFLGGSWDDLIGGVGIGMPNWFASILIWVNNPTLNRNIGKFNLPHIWDRVSLNTPCLNFMGDSAAPHRKVVPRQPALTPREIALYPQRQVVPKQRTLDSQAVSTSPQATNTNFQGDSAVQAGSPQVDNADSQEISTSSQAVSITSHGDSVVASRERVLTPRQLAPVLKQSALTPR